jgi:hypothetical protein
VVNARVAGFPKGPNLLVIGITTEVCNHTLSGTCIAAYLENGGTLEKALYCTNCNRGEPHQVQGYGALYTRLSPKQPPSPVAHMKSLLEVAKRELDEVTMQFRDPQFDQSAG